MRFRAALAVGLGTALVLAVTTPAPGQQLMIYPGKGQSPEQQSRDQAECHSWAVQQSGFDPASPPPPAAVAGSGPQGGVLQGAARGAVVGVVGGAIMGDAGKGAAVGAATGGLIGGFRRVDQQREIAQQQAQYDQQIAYMRQNYNRAMSACLQGRGYTVS